MSEENYSEVNYRGYEEGREVCKWCGCSLPFGMMATCFESPNGLCELPAALLEASTIEPTEEEVNGL